MGQAHQSSKGRQPTTVVSDLPRWLLPKTSAGPPECGHHPLNRASIKKQPRNSAGSARCTRIEHGHRILVGRRSVISAKTPISSQPFPSSISYRRNRLSHPTRFLSIASRRGSRVGQAHQSSKGRLPTTVVSDLPRWLLPKTSAGPPECGHHPLNGASIKKQPRNCAGSARCTRIEHGHRILVGLCSVISAQNPDLVATFPEQHQLPTEPLVPPYPLPVNRVATWQ